MFIDSIFAQRWLNSVAPHAGRGRRKACGRAAAPCDGAARGAFASVDRAGAGMDLKIYGYESKCKTWGTTDLSLFLVFTIQLLGYSILTHTHMDMCKCNYEWDNYIWDNYNYMIYGYLRYMSSIIIPCKCNYMYRLKWDNYRTHMG